MADVIVAARVSQVAMGTAVAVPVAPSKTLSFITLPDDVFLLLGALDDHSACHVAAVVFATARTHLTDGLVT